MRAAWLFVVIMFALGTAGLVTAMAHLPGTDSRGELTWRADQAIKPALDTATEELDRIATDFEALGQQGRLAVAALAQGDAVQLEDAMAAGQVLVDKIVVSVAGIRAGLRTLPGFGPVQEGFFSGPTIERWNSINAAVDTTDGLGAIWLSLTTGGTDAVRLMSLLDEHDEFVGSAAKVGSEGNYTEAVNQLDLAAPVFGQLRTLQLQLSNRVDVALLAELLDRTARVDDALRALYTLLVLTNGAIDGGGRGGAGRRRGRAGRAARGHPGPFGDPDRHRAGRPERGRDPHRGRARSSPRRDRGTERGRGVARRRGRRGRRGRPGRRWRRRGTDRRGRVAGRNLAATLAPHRVPARPRPGPSPDVAHGGPPAMQLTVVVDQPWSVAADVLVVPVALDPAFEGRLGELDRRSGGELSALKTFGELSGKKYSTAIAASGKVRAGRILTVGVGDPAQDRPRNRGPDGGHRRAPAGRARGAFARRLARCPADRRWRLGGVAEAVARGIVEGSFDPATIYREKVDSAPPVLDELILIAPGARASGPTSSARRTAGASSARARTGHAGSPTVPPTTSRPRSSPTRRGRSRASTASRSTSSSPSGRASSAWACSWRSGGAATTRPG